MAYSPIKWFQDARFGLFLHWGLYSVLAGEWQGQRMEYIGEWIGSRFRIPEGEYEKLATRFDPQNFDAEAWVLLAKKAGMRYIVFTAKHHEGFAMYHSRVDQYNIVDATPFGRDPLAELAQVCQRYGLGLGLYYSQDLDWHDPDGGDPGPDFPKNFGMSWGNDWDYPDRSIKDFAVYFEHKVKPQVRELLTQYGPVCLLWFDIGIDISPQQSQELYDLVKALQPDCLVNTRIGNGLGDYGSLGDNQVPSAYMPGVWEIPATLNDTWGYKSFDHNWKTAQDTLGILVGAASKNVNYLLNIGPQPDGCLPQEAVEILESISCWMEDCGQSIHGTRQSPFPYDFEWGWITQQAREGDQPAKLYLLFRQWPESDFHLYGLNSTVSCSYIFTQDREPISYTQSRRSADKVMDLTLKLPLQIPLQVMPVVVLELENDPVADPRLISQINGFLSLPASRALVHSDDTMTAPLLTLDGSGIIANWLDTRQWVEWEVVFPAVGDYTVEVVTSAVNHSRVWTGGHQVRIEAKDGFIDVTLAMDELIDRPETRCYAQAVSHCGNLHFASVGEQKITLKALQILPVEGIGLALVTLHLKLIS